MIGEDRLEAMQRKMDALQAQMEDLRTQEYNMAQNHGWYNSAWQKDPLRRGFSGQISRSVVNTSLPAGTSNQDDSAVSAGEEWVLTHGAITYIGTVAGVSIQMIVVAAGSVQHVLIDQRNLTSGQWYTWDGEIDMVEGDFLRLTVQGATLNDDGYMRALGRRVDIDQ